MLTPEDVRRWVALGESEILEFKRSTGGRREAAQTLCAMLNTRGGRVLFGVDAAGSVVGQNIGDRSIEELSAELRGIEPPVFPQIDRIRLHDDLEVLVVTVSRGSSCPYSVRGTAYSRLGNTTVALSRDEYNRMLLERLHGERRWENEIAEGWSVEDLEATELATTLTEAVRRGRQGDPGTRDPLSLLRGFGLLKDNQLTKAAVVLFGRVECLESRMPQCLLRLARFRGTSKAEFIDNRQFHGNVFDLLLKADRFLRDSLPVAGRVVPRLFERLDDPLYPPVALREALANAVCHRDYTIGGGSVSVAIFDDRLEITSSGTLHFGLTPEALFRDHESLPWNPAIAAVLYRRGIVERWGRGTLMMADLAEQAGLPRPEIEESGGCVTVRFRPSHYIPPSRVQLTLSAQQRELLAALDAHDRVPLRQLKALLGDRSEWSLKSDLAALKKLGLVQSEGHARGAVWFRVRSPGLAEQRDSN